MTQAVFLRRSMLPACAFSLYPISIEHKKITGIICYKKSAAHLSENQKIKRAGTFVITCMNKKISLIDVSGCIQKFWKFFMFTWSGTKVLYK